MSTIARSTFSAALGAAALAPLAARAQTTTLRVGAPLTDSFGTPWFIKDAGAFARSGYDVELSTIPAASAVAAAVAGGALELGVSDLVSTAQAVQKGVPIAMIAPCGLYSSSEPVTALYVAKSSPIQKPKDLEGHSLAVPQIGGLSTAALRAWLAENKVDIDKVKIVEVPQPSANVAIVRGTVDSGILGEPFITPVKNDIRDVGHPLDAIAKTYVLSAWFAQRSWLDADRARSRRILDAIYETARWANGHRSETAAILARDGKMDVNMVLTMNRTRFGTSLVLAEVQPVLDASAKVKLLDRPLDASAFVWRP
jgi:ABC-type nitrate/sulfonate/bicarbonate transport system substrate-binding protein